MDIHGYFPLINSYDLPFNLLPETVRVLRDEGAGKTESLVFWAGRVLRDRAELSTIIVPKGSGVQKHPQYVRISDAAMLRVAELLNPPDRVLLAQVHTHRRAAFHSPTDDSYGFRSPGFISIVIGNYAADAVPAIDTWAAWECTDGVRFRELLPAELSARFRVRQDLPLRILEAT
ncbi:MAG: hypothetical protein NUW12_09560 [Firmicutes bacterium]|jgi:hypothetical protein|nr:hypothetical protein [Bacillota bacterium]MDH7496235.1 hypothetical protein [Bacillota bacterium]